MADSSFNFEHRLRKLGVIENRNFTTAAGQTANLKINLEKVAKLDSDLMAEIAGILAVRMSLYKPDVLIPVPDGANEWAEQVAIHMNKEHIELQWLNKAAGRLRFKGVSNIAKVRKAERAGLIDDVFTTGSTIRKVASHPDIAKRVVAAGIIWNRSSQNPQLGFPVETIINSYVPLMDEDEVK